ncbi:RidA family protein [Polymorphobacter fuscus]|uniref:RidA family protein n=1 Tax=Sandarakinorhabdus fusca TaxID=1439888 RepID=A0A7C9GNN6_9SPHN|nr:RidA family protein [Polymorphobacter fuscus]KAB7647589.1 RidA family protein [Polymorphobacter fuscus]MQT16857.1 RidA family protein [Polymorphobacter fuscus]NJC09154.1 enamine deaminase RidA (YjgF/YER057c/UK114 family) [Polymorphobacter fuscus]
MARQNIFSGSPYESRVGYCRAVAQPPFVFVSGTVGIDMDSGELPADVESQCANALRIVEVALRHGGATFADVVRVTYYAPDRADFEACWPQLQATFGSHPPASTMVVAGLIDPAMRIEIEVTAMVDSAATA